MLSISIYPCRLMMSLSGNLSIKSLVDVVSREDVLQDSEYLETLLVAVPK